MQINMIVATYDLQPEIHGQERDGHKLNTESASQRLQDDTSGSE